MSDGLPPTHNDVTFVQSVMCGRDAKRQLWFSRFDKESYESDLEVIAQACLISTDYSIDSTRTKNNMMHACNTMETFTMLWLLLMPMATILLGDAEAFLTQSTSSPSHHWQGRDRPTLLQARTQIVAHPLIRVAPLHSSNRKGDDLDDDVFGNFWSKLPSTVATIGLTLAISTCTMFGGSDMAAFAADKVAYDGFAEYAQENQMQQSDVACFVTKCLDQTKALFSNPRGIKGTTCLGRCKGEPTCAQRCFAEFGSDDLNNWLSCTIEENECVKVPKNVDNSAELTGYSNVIRNFDPTTLVGEWYKTYGLDPNNDLFDCQTNTFATTTPDGSEMDLGIFFRVQRPEEAGGGFWENHLTEHMVVDAVTGESDPSGRTMHTQGKMFGLQFYENWFILGESDGKGTVPPFKLVAYKGHTLQGNYDGAFVYSKEPRLPQEAIPAVRAAAENAGLNWDKFQPIDNTCPTGNILNDAGAGTGTSTSDWLNLVVGEGGVIDWISPGWRGEYKK